MQTIKKNLDTISLLKHMLESARERVSNPKIDPDYKALLESRIPEIERKILIFEQSVN